MTTSSLLKTSNFFPNVIFETCDRGWSPWWTTCITSNNKSTLICVGRRIIRYPEYYVIPSAIPALILWITFCYFTSNGWKRGNSLLDSIDRIHNPESRSLIHVLNNSHQWQMAIDDKKPMIKPYNEKTSMMVHFWSYRHRI